MKPYYTLADLLDEGHPFDAGESVPAKLAVIGFPIAHSKSPAMQQAALDAAGIRARYIRIQASPDEFGEVVHACARTEQPEEQWIDGQIEEAYGKLHEMGFAHSVECWDEEGLQGGLYGVALGKAFFGESMFHRKTDASKIALVALVQYLRAHQFLFLDTQWTTPHLLKFGTYEVPAEEYRKMLKRALAG